MLGKELIKEYELSDVTTDEIHIVDLPCVPKAAFRLLKNKEEDSQMLTEELIKSMTEAAKIIEAELEKVTDDKEKKRLNLILGNIKSMLKKGENGDDDSELEADLQKMMKEVFSDVLEKEVAERVTAATEKEKEKEEIEKAGRKLSKATGEELIKIAASLSATAKSIEMLVTGKKVKDEEEEEEPDKKKKKKKDVEYDKPYEEYPKVKKSVLDPDTLKEFKERVFKTYDLHKRDVMSEKEINQFVDTLFECLFKVDEEE